MGFFKRLFRIRKNKGTITFCGVELAGKTSLVNYLMKEEELEDPTPTTGVNTEFIKSNYIDLDIHDLGGQKEFRSSWQQLNKFADAMVYVIDRNDRKRLPETMDLLQKVVNELSENSIIGIFLNKIDIMNGDGITREEILVNYNLLENLKGRRWSIFETSAITGENVMSSMVWVIKEILKRYGVLDDVFAS